jgi:hypothetical protein
MADVVFSECQYLGPEYDSFTWDYQNKPTPYCGCKTLEGKSYCHEHYYVVYKKGSSNLKNNTKAIEAEIRDIELKKLIAQQEADEGELANV